MKTSVLVASLLPAAEAFRFGAISMRAPFDPRSVTETFEMYMAAAPPAGFVWGYDTRSTTENYEQWVTSQAAADTAPAPPPPPTATAAAGVPSVGETVLSWYDAGVRITDDETPTASPAADDASVAEAAEERVAAALYKLSAAQAVAYIEAERPALLAAGVKPSRIFAALNVVTTAAARVQAEKEAAEASLVLTVSQACAFLADASLGSLSTADKKAFLASKGVSAFVMAQAECVAPEDNVQGHSELPAPEVWPMLGGVNTVYKPKPAGGTPACIFTSVEATTTWPMLGGANKVYKLKPAGGTPACIFDGQAEKATAPAELAMA